MTRIRGTAAERAYAAWSALSDAEKAEYETIKRTVAKFVKPNGAPEKRPPGRPRGSRTAKPSLAGPFAPSGTNAAAAEGL